MSMSKEEQLEELKAAMVIRPIRKTPRQVTIDQAAESADTLYREQERQFHVEYKELSLAEYLK